MINHFTHELSDKSYERCHCLIRRKKHVEWRENVNAVWIPLPFSRKIQTYFIHTVKLSKIAQKKCTNRRKRLIKSSTAFYHVMITWVAKALPSAQVTRPQRKKYLSLHVGKWRYVVCLWTNIWRSMSYTKQLFGDFIREIFYIIFKSWMKSKWANNC